MFAPEPGCGSKRPHLRQGRTDGVIAIVTAIPEEFHAIAKRVSDGERRRMGKGDRGVLLRGRIAGVPVLLAASRDGSLRASGCVSFLLREFPVSCLVGAGAAGALGPSLSTGEILVAARVVDEKGDAPLPDAGWISRAVALGARPGTFVTVARPLTSSKEKSEVALRFGVPDPAVAVVDMESAGWARAAASRGIPYVILRAVSDTFEEELPGFLSSCLSAEGSVDRVAVARRLLVRPGALPVLLKARERVREGAGRVGLFLEKVLSEKI